jgi:hypothetical protein
VPIAESTCSTFQSSAAVPSMTRSALAADGRTNAMLDGRTVASYCRRTDSGVRPRSMVSRLMRRSKQTSSGVSTYTRR